MSAIKNLTDQRFGRLVARTLSPERTRKSGAIWICECDCGTVLPVPTVGLSTGNTQSCGCLQRDRASETNQTHKQSATRTYWAWGNMKKRCQGPGNSHYHRYGGRGIRVCDRWATSFENFLADMGEAPPGLSVERKDNNGHYSPENCVWATAEQQGRNKSTNHIIIVDGVAKTLGEWCKQYSLNYSAVINRQKHGWPKERWFEPARVWPGSKKKCDT